MATAWLNVMVPMPKPTSTKMLYNTVSPGSPSAITIAAQAHSPRGANAKPAQTRVVTAHPMDEASRLPTDCTVASSPKADPRIPSGASAATDAFSAVSTQPSPMGRTYRGPHLPT